MTGDRSIRHLQFLPRLSILIYPTDRARKRRDNSHLLSPILSRAKLLIPDDTRHP